ncbi:HET-domain-containing protein [Aspergillus welwitschiae]|uniref:HET-domain-containing protein n=1 Tax=Aspergillus welwitschiae TaxID=1341132 RepID=A0A3F3Q7I8_9EURO|nr:HET-domain-containing protein [Aspergillus welwitschiae]RDH35007.1 HET-domain-containing protein [Aspergillus welwitschiae]
MPRKAYPLLKSVPGILPKLTGRKEKYKESSTSTDCQNNSSSRNIFVLEDPADFPRWEGINERVLPVNELGHYKENPSTHLEKSYNFLYRYVPRQFHHHFPHPRMLSGFSEAEMQFSTLWEAVRRWAIDCDTCGLVRRKVLSDPLDPVKAREHPTSRFLVEADGGKYCPHCKLIYRCLQAYYPSFETDKDTLVVGVYPTAGGFSLLIRNTRTTSWIESTLWAEVFPESKKREIDNHQASSVFDSSCESSFQWILNRIPQADGDLTLSNFMPRRLIYLGDGASKPVLVDRPEEIYPYCALSYCWGPTQANLKTTKETLINHCHHIDKDHMPKTVQDAVEVCRRLGIKYLWVDALCIIQDDALGVDWYEQSSEMDQIYSSAYVVIAADTAEDCSEGFLGTSSVQQLREVTVDWIKANFICRDKPNGQSDDPSFLLKRTPLSRRAWTLQETLLPSRVLHYTGTEIVLRLGETFHCQCGKCSFHHVGTSHSDWHQIVSHYSFRQMTKPSDKLSALSGLAARTSDGDRKYLAGLWSDTLVIDLLWYVTGSGLHMRPEPWRAPTWSWASMDGGISYFNRFSYYDFLPALDIIEAECKCLSVNSFGPVSSGFIELRGKLVPVEMAILNKPFTKHQGEYTGEWGRATRVHQGQTSLVRGWGTEIYEVLCDERMDQTDEIGEEESESWAQGRVDRQDLGRIVASNIYCLEIGTVIDRVIDVDGFTALGRSSRVWWLVLKKAEKVNEFKRVGIGYKSSKDFKRDCDLFVSAEWSTVRLV